MNKIHKVLCELDKQERKTLREEIVLEVKAPRFICRKCIRVCTSKELLCKPQRL